MSPTPQTPPTDRPLTAGDVPLLREGDVLRLQVATGPSDRAGDLFEFEAECPAHRNRIRVRPVGSRAFYAWHPSHFTFVSRPATSAASEGVDVDLGDVERLVLAVMPGDGMCYSFAALEAQLEDDRPAPERPIIEAAVRLLSARGLLRFQRGLFNEDGCTYGSGYGLTDKGLAKQAALASSPVSERERELSFSVDDLAQEIRRVGGNHSLGAGALAEALMPFLTAQPSGEPTHG